MSAADKLLTIAENVPKVYNAGYEKGKTEGGGDSGDNYREELWGKITQNGTITNCSYLFAGRAWNNDTFELGYNLQPKDAQSMFSNCGTLDLIDVFEKTGKTIDFSQCTRVSGLFDSSGVTRIGVVDLSKVNTRTYYSKAFYNCKNLTTIEKLIQTQNVAIDSSIFGFTTSLSHIIIEGTIYQNFTINASPLDLESAKSVLLALENYAGTDKEFDYKIYLSATAWNNLDTDGATSPNGNTWREYVNDIGWNVG